MPSTRRKKYLSKPLKILIVVIAVLVILRLLLPSIVLHYANKSLANLDGYYGHVDDIDISLYRGAYQINGMYLNHVDKRTGKQTDFFKVTTIDLSVEWSALFHGSLVGELEFESPQLIFTKNKTEISDVKKDTNDFRKILKDFMPLKVNRFEVNNGSIHYSDKTASPDVDVALTQTYILAQNLRNVEDTRTVLPSTVVAHANAYGGSMSLNMKLNLLAERATFDLNAEVKNTNLVSLNDFLKAYGGFDVNKGTFGLYTEFAAKNGKYKGYVKPVIKDLDVVGREDKGDSFFQKAYETLVGAAGKILENRKKEQVATKVPIEGEFGASHTNVVEAIFQLLKNAFIQALLPSVDNQININSVDQNADEHQSLLHKIFGGGKKKDAEENKK
ncbi:MAG TPA: DUF748 domain-containing protein [Parafilimonas sp.]|nr:DUF748 domain-containing protein [Parafilimonas sp.]